MSKKDAKKILPLGLLVEGRACLVVGGGTVAGRKAEALLEAGANVTLVAPELGERVMALQSVHSVKIIRRSYSPDDLDQGFFLVFAGTDDHALNQQIIEACRDRRILCACPDRGWQNGDFISPASFRKGDVTVSVSTGGASCRRSRLIKEHLARQMATLEQPDMFVMGTDYRVANLAQRESIHLAGPRFEQAGMMFRKVQGLHEFMLLNTCNRVELIGLASAPLLTSGVLNRILGLDRLEGRYYIHEGRDAPAYDAGCLRVAVQNTRRNQYLRTGESGAQVTDCVLYRNIPIRYQQRPSFDAAVFASGSAVHAFVANWGTTALTEALPAAIGRPTAVALENCGCKSFLVAPDATAESMVRTLAARCVEQDIET